jgi:hypothetical protein
MVRIHDHADHADSTPKIGSRRSRSYLLRVCQEAPTSPWWAMLREVTTKQEYFFHGGLVTFLETGVEEMAHLR